MGRRKTRNCAYCGTDTRDMDWDAKEEHFAEHKARGDEMNYLFGGLGVFLTSTTTDPDVLRAQMDAAAKRAVGPRLRVVKTKAT